MKTLLKKIFFKLQPPKNLLIDFNGPIYFALKKNKELFNIENKYLRNLKLIYTFLFRKKNICELYNLVINERIVELPFVFENLNLKEKSKIIEIGCCNSKLSIELASLGYLVVGVDLNDYQFEHPNFEFVKGNFLNKNTLQKNFFDAVIAVSCIEHFGLGAYRDKPFKDGDLKAVDEIYRILKKSGIFLMTVPFGKKGATPRYRVYNERSLNHLLKKFKIKKEKYFIGINRKSWIPAKKEKLLEIDSFSKGFVEGVACILAEK